MKPVEPQRHRALIVEDDPAIRRLVEKLLLRHNFEIDAAADGRAAVRKLELMVPEVNGFELIDYLREKQVPTPVAVVSAVSQQALTKLDLDIVKLVISNPFDVEEFTKSILGLCRDAELA